MYIVINDRAFWVKSDDAKDYLLVSTDIDSYECVLLDGTASQWTIEDLLKRLEQWSKMSNKDLLNITKYKVTP